MDSKYFNGSRCFRSRPGIVNFRDFGGIRLPQRCVIRRGLLFRTANLSGITEEDAAWLCFKVGLRTFVDLRTEREAARDGLPLKIINRHVRRIHHPISSRDVFLNGISRPMPSDYVSAYLDMLEPAGRTLKALIPLILEGDAIPLAIGCTAGKDRTGLVSALLLAALRAQPNVIAKDYSLSARCLRSHLSLFRDHWEKRGISARDYAIRLECVPSTILRVLEAVQQRYDSVDGFLDSVNIGSQDLETLRARLVALESAQ